MTKQAKIVCLGGGIGTVNLMRGLKEHTKNITVVVSMADDGGSAGRLRRVYDIHPTGDLISCMAAMIEDSNPSLAKLLTYRFPGDRYGKDDSLLGHKLGNLVMVALRNITHDIDKTIEEFQKVFNIPGEYLPATLEKLTLSAKTKEGKIITGEETIDLGKYEGQRVLDEVYIHPKNAAVNPRVLSAIASADCIIAGPGDLYTNVLPVLLVPKIANALTKSNTTKIFIVNVANKPFETKGYAVSDYIDAIQKHIGSFPFSKVIVNTEYSHTIPEKYDYKYVELKKHTDTKGIEIVQGDFVDTKFPLYHNPQKLAKAVAVHI